MHPLSFGRSPRGIAAVTALLSLTAVGVSVPASAQLLGPTAYLSSADSPFSGGSFSYFHLENFEDGTLNVPGVTASAGAPVGPNGNTDSVDGDDGAIDGFGTAGNSFFSGSGSTGISFTFSTATLGSLPTHAGIVWTDGSDTITFQAFDATNTLIGTMNGDHADGSFSGTTGEDRFYGVINSGGIARIFISNAGGGIEVDHLQFGLAAGSTAAPEPGTLALLALGAGIPIAAAIRRRRK